jgi:hypothetical protein
MLGEAGTPGRVERVPWQLAKAGGVHLATAYRWLNGESSPSPLAQSHLLAAGVVGFEVRRPAPKRRRKRRR